MYSQSDCHKTHNAPLQQEYVDSMNTHTFMYVCVSMYVLHIHVCVTYTCMCHAS